MKLSLFLFLIFATFQATYARQMYKVKCYTPSKVEDRSKLAKFIHLDMIQDDYVVAIINEAELKDVKTNTNLEIEILSAFDTDKNGFNLTDFNNMLLLRESDENVLAFHASYILSSKSSLSIDIDQLIKEKMPTQQEVINMDISSGPLKAKGWTYNQKTKILTILADPKSSGQSDNVELTSSLLFSPVIKLSLVIDYH